MGRRERGAPDGDGCRRRHGRRAGGRRSAPGQGLRPPRDRLLLPRHRSRSAACDGAGRSRRTARRARGIEAGAAAPRDVASMPLGTLAHHVSTRHTRCSTASSHSFTPWRSRSAKVHGDGTPSSPGWPSWWMPCAPTSSPPRQGGGRSSRRRPDRQGRAVGGDTGPLRADGSVTSPRVRAEHEVGGRLLDELRAASGGFALPDAPAPATPWLTKAWPPSTPTTRVMCTPRTTALPAPWRGAARVGAS